MTELTKIGKKISTQKQHQGWKFVSLASHKSSLSLIFKFLRLVSIL